MDQILINSPVCNEQFTQANTSGHVLPSEVLIYPHMCYFCPERFKMRLGNHIMEHYKEKESHSDEYYLQQGSSLFVFFLGEGMPVLGSGIHIFLILSILWIHTYMINKEQVFSLPQSMCQCSVFFLQGSRPRALFQKLL